MSTAVRRLPLATPVRCRWVLCCTATAVETVLCPVLGEVPACLTCAEEAERLGRVEWWPGVELVAQDATGGAELPVAEINGAPEGDGPGVSGAPWCVGPRDLRGGAVGDHLAAFLAEVEAGARLRRAVTR